MARLTRPSPFETHLRTTTPLMRPSTQLQIRKSLRPSLTSSKEHKLENRQVTSWPPPWNKHLSTTEHGPILNQLLRNNSYHPRHRYKQSPKCMHARWGTESSMSSTRNGANMPAVPKSMMLPRCLPSTIISTVPSIRR